MRQEKFADGGIKREPVHALSGRVDEHRAGAVDNISRSDLLVARLEAILERALSRLRQPAIDAEDGADGNVRVDVRGAVQRIVEKHVLSVRILIGNVKDVLIFLGCHHAKMAAMVHRLIDRLIGKFIKFLHHITAHVHPVGGAEDVHESGFANLAPHELCGEREIVQEAGKISRRIRVLTLLLVDKSFERHELFCCWVLAWRLHCDRAGWRELTKKCTDFRFD